MLAFIQADNFEYTYLPNETFQFNCFYIRSSNTLSHWHNHTEIIYIEKGQCHIFIDGNLFACASGDFLVVPPGCLHSILPQGHCDHYAIVMGESLMSAMVKDSHLSPLITPFISKGGIEPLHVRPKDTAYEACFQQVNALMVMTPNQTPYYEACIKLQICQLMLQLNISCSQHTTQASKATTVNTQLLKMAISHLQTHYNEKITVQDLANAYGLSAQHFSRLFKAYTGKTIIDYLTQLRLECAYQLLMTTDLPITQIPEVTGFCNSNYFSRVYKMQFNQTPSQTRKGHGLNKNK